MKTILITGGCGFIGSHFVRRFLKKHQDFKVVNLDKLTYAGNPDNLKDISKIRKYKFVKGDIADKKTVEKVFKKFKPDFVVNFAAESHVDRSIHGHARDFVDTNIYGVFNLLEAALRQSSPRVGDAPLREQAQGKLKKFVQISTDEVYGSLPLKGVRSHNKNGPDPLKFTEKTQYSPRSPYSASKAAGDLLCYSYFATYNLPVVVTHSSNNYGSYQYPEKLIPFFALRASKGAALPLYGDGKNIRDWIYVLDNVEAIEKVLFKGRPGETYNIGGDNEVANIDIARKILKILKKPDSLIKYVSDRPGHDRRYALDSSKVRKELGWKPKHNFNKMIRETVKWYRDNPEWVRSALKRLKKVNPHIEV